MTAWLPPPDPPAIVWVQARPDKPPPAAQGPATITCDATGVIECQVIERVSANKSVEDLRTIATYVARVSERNRRMYRSFEHRAPSAAYEVVRLAHTRPFLPGGDSYGITDLKIVLREDENRVLVRYPRRADGRGPWVEYEATLTTFMRAVEEASAKLKRYDPK